MGYKCDVGYSSVAIDNTF